MSQPLQYTISQSGNITVYVNFQPYHVNVGAANYDRVMELIKGDAPDKVDLLIQALDIRTAISTQLGDYIKIAETTLYYKEVAVTNSLAQRIVDFFHKGYPVNNLIRFFERLQSNPSEKSQNELFNFLEKNGLIITDDGYFLGYKAVTKDYKDKRTGQFDNRVGKTPTEDRKFVDPNPNVHCSRGLHVGTYSYATGFMSTYANDRLVLCKVDPADCVSVPNDGNEKLRTCKYHVIADVTGKGEITESYVKENLVSEVKPPKNKAVEGPKTEVKPGTPQRDSKGRFIKNSGGIPTVKPNSNTLPQRDASGRFLPKKK